MAGDYVMSGDCREGVAVLEAGKNRVGQREISRCYRWRETPKLLQINTRAVVGAQRSP